MPCNVSKLSPRPFSRLWLGAVAAVARRLTASNQFASLAGPRPGSRTSLTLASGHRHHAGQWHGGKRQNVETWRCGAECSVLPNTRMGARTSLSGTIIYNQLHWNGRWWDKIFLRVPVTSKKMKKILFISTEDSILYHNIIPFFHPTISLLSRGWFMDLQMASMDSTVSILASFHQSQFLYFKENIG